MKNQLNRIQEARTSQPTGTNSGPSCDRDVSLSPEVQRATERWLPQNVTPDQRAMLPVVLPVVRCWVAAARPSTPKEARIYLWATIQIALWAYSEFHTLDPEVVLSIHNVEYFTMFECADRSNGWRQEARWKLRCVGRAANPDGWPPKPPQLGPSPIVLPYSAAEEAMFVHAARGSEASNRASRLAVAGFSLGAGLKGNEIKVVTPEDVVEHNSGVITVRVAGRHPRLVPIRASYADVIREAVQAANGARFIPAEGRCPVSDVAARLLENPEATGRRNGLRLRRARNTWLVAHLEANTPFAALRAIAGPLAGKTLDALIEHVHAGITPENAVEQGMRA